MAPRPTLSPILGPRSGDRVVAIAEVGPSTIVIHGHGTYQCTVGGALPDTLVERVQAGVEAADTVLHDFNPWLSVVCAAMPSERAARTTRHLHSHETRRRSTHSGHRAYRLAETIRRDRRVMLERGGVISADACLLVMRSDAFIDYASGVTVTTVKR